jgi:hypothetical protein
MYSDALDDMATYGLPMNAKDRRVPEIFRGLRSMIGFQDLMRRRSNPCR